MRLGNSLKITLLAVIAFSGSYLYSELGSVTPTPGEAPPTFDIGKVFSSCPIIYSILLILSVAASVIWVYSIFTLKLNEMMPEEFTHTVRQQLSDSLFEEAIEYCQRENNFASSIIVSGLNARGHGPQVIMDVIQAEGRRAGNIIWQRLGLLNDIAVIAPMLGLLGTVLGLFFAFYDTSSTAENISSIFDGLGIAVGTTVLGLIVAILAMIFYTSLKYRVVNLLNSIENESLSLVSLIQTEKKEKKL
ncbi:MAG: MotA/TolQ/ExbB proton channel family protein [Chlamydiota bacterium]|nr:MotA/TolQ/ExbB proton channel family protein [Chlamydiota bacterium]